MKNTWSDILEIAIDLAETFPEIDPKWISFPDLHQKICNLDNFEDPSLSKTRYLKIY